MEEREPVNQIVSDTFELLGSLAETIIKSGQSCEQSV